MRQFRAAHARLCHDAAVNAVHWQCLVAGVRDVIALFTVVTEYAERATCVTMPGSSPERCRDAWAVVMQMRQTTAEMQRRLEQGVLAGLRSGGEMEQRAALTLLLRWCGMEPRTGDFSRYVWDRETAAAVHIGQQLQGVADSNGQVDAAEPAVRAQDEAGRVPERGGPLVTRRVTWRTRAAASMPLLGGARTLALVRAASLMATPAMPSTVPAHGPPLPTRGADGGPADKASGTLSRAQWPVPAPQLQFVRRCDVGWARDRSGSVTAASRRAERWRRYRKQQGRC